MTYKEWLENNLPENVAKKAIANTGDLLLNTPVPQGTPLLYAFIWSKSREGYVYWDNWNEKTK